MRFAFDPEKDRRNRAKHGVSLALAEVLFLELLGTFADDRFDYGEVRQIAYGRINRRLFICVYADRGDERRVISLRKANQREVGRYGQDPE